jgi:hypothetical protein
MNKKKPPYLLGLVIWFAAYIGACSYWIHTGLDSRVRWSGLALVAALAVMYILLPRKAGSPKWLVLRAVAYFTTALIWLVLLVRGGNTVDGLLASTFFGFAAGDLYDHYKARQASLQNNQAQ